MDKVATFSRAEKTELFNQAAGNMSLSPIIIEKDFWVCWLLKQLFSIKEFENTLVFKGGTSLSKCFGLINRFSEDIDIAVNYEQLGFIGDKGPLRNDLSRTKRSDLLKEMLLACQNYIANVFVPLLRSRITEVIGADGWQLLVSSNDANVVEFEYPAIVKSDLTYIPQKVMLELGTHAEPVPNEQSDIISFAGQQFPTVFKQPRCSVLAVVAKRTFWEKATILHAEYYRALDKVLPQRYSRHYADVAAMSQTPIVDAALADIALLKKVITHKDLFYPCGWARYHEACPGTFHLVPRSERASAIARDYRDMAPMFFRQPTDLNTVLEQLQNFENRINKL